MLTRQKIMLLIRLKPGHPQHILTGIRKYAIGFNHWLWRGVSPETKAIELIKTWRPDGIIGTIRTGRIAEAIATLKIPSVDVGGFLERSPGGRIGPDDLQIGGAAADYYIKKGYRHFAFVGHANAFFSHQRHRGFVAALQASDFNCESLLVNAFHDFCSSADQPVEWTGEIPKLRSWLKRVLRHKRPLAIFCSHDEYALAVLASCGTLNIQVPDDAAVLGTDDNELVCALATPPLSSIGHNGEQIGYEAAKLLDALLNKQAHPRTSITLPSTAITVRESTDRLMFSDADVVAAVRVIRAHLSRRLRVADVVDTVCTSRRSLEMKFKKYLGHGIHREILKARVDLAKKLMSETHLPLKAVSTRAGFVDRNRMLLAFRAVTGMTPRTVRRHLEHRP